MKINFLDNPKPINIFVGPFGTGKTETAVNYSMALKNAGHKVTLVDLDIINPYFRSWEAAKRMHAGGVKVVAPDEKLIYVDIPGIPPIVQGLLKSPPGIVVLDIGGDDLGATVLGRFHNLIDSDIYNLFFVVNPYRPSWRSVDHIKKILFDVERVSRLKVTAIVSNAHLIKETTPKVVLEGHCKVEELAATMGLTVAFAVAEEQYTSLLNEEWPELCILKIERFMLPLWERQDKEV